MGKSKSALPDLTKVIELKPDFTSVSFSFQINEVWTEVNIWNWQLVLKCKIKVVIFHCGTIDDARERVCCKVSMKAETLRLIFQRTGPREDLCWILTASHCCIKWWNKWRTLWSAGLGNQSVASAVLISVCIDCLLQNGFLLSLFFLKAQLQRGNLLLKQGRLDEAEGDYKEVVSKLWTLTREVQVCPAGGSVHLCKNVAH